MKTSPLRYAVGTLISRLSPVSRQWCRLEINRAEDALNTHETQLRELDAVINGAPSLVASGGHDLAEITRQLQAWQASLGGVPLVQLLADARRWADLRAAAVADDWTYTERMGQILGKPVGPFAAADLDAAADQIRAERHPTNGS